MIDPNIYVRLTVATEKFRQSMETMLEILADMNKTIEIQVWENEGGACR
jgi:hypothetical protein